MNLSIIGAGLIGQKRANALPPGVNLKIICDTNAARAQKLAKEFKCNFETDFQKVIQNKDIDAVFVCTTNNFLSKITTEAIKAGKHTLIEKPGARNLAQLNQVYKAFKKNPVVLLYGYNLRFHQAIIKAKKIIESKIFGDIMFIRAKYGHGGRLGYASEWRFNKEISGGGELLDQGSHLIDLVNFFCGKMDKVTGLTRSFFWKGDLEDSAFMLLSNKKGQIAQLSATCVEWKNIFSLEIMLKIAKIQIDGLGGSYGKEKLTLYKMKPQMGPPDLEEHTFDEDTSWKEESQLFFDRIRKKDYTDQSIKDAIYVLDTIEKIYI